MSKNKYGQKRTVPFRRKREGRTDYRRRLALLKSGLPRLVIRRTRNTVTCQVVEFSPDGDKVLASSSSRNLESFGWRYHPGNMPSAYLTGLLLGQKAKKAGIEKAVLDLGLQTHGGRVFATLKGVLDAGVDVPSSDEGFPSDERMSGKHIADYAAKLKEDQDIYKRRFAYYLKQGVKPEDIVSIFNEVKDKILAV